MVRKVGFWYVLVVTAASQIFGQDRPFLKETKVLGGKIVETFVPDLPLTPVPDPAFQQAAQPQAVAPQGQFVPSYQQQQYQQQIAVAPQHQNGCGCPVCQRRILSQRTQERRKTIREITTVTVVEERHPTRVIQYWQPPPRREYRPPQNPCGSCQPYGWHYNRPGFFGTLFGVNSGINVRGYGGFGYPPPYAQSGYGWAGNQPWYGGRQW